MSHAGTNPSQTRNGQDQVTVGTDKPTVTAGTDKSPTDVRRVDKAKSNQTRTSPSYTQGTDKSTAITPRHEQLHCQTTMSDIQTTLLGVKQSNVYGGQTRTDKQTSSDKTNHSPWPRSDLQEQWKDKPACQPIKAGTGCMLGITTQSSGWCRGM